MGELLVSLIPLALGVVMSPLAIMALVAVLVSRRARANGVAYLLGWILALIVVSGLSLFLIGLIGTRRPESAPLWLDILRLVLGAGLIFAAVLIYRRGSKRVKQMAAASTMADVVAAAPQLPGWLKAVDTFTPPRSGSLGLGIFLLNPVDVSCAFLAMADISQADLSSTASTVLVVVFIAVGVAPIAIPVILALVKGAAADPFLERVRGWIAGHTSALNAGLLLVIGAMQLQKALSALVA